MTAPRPPQAHSSDIPLDTLGKFADRGFRLFGSCLRCASGYRPALMPQNAPSMYDIDLAALVAERGRDCHIVGMRAVPCPYCGSNRTELRFLPPEKGSGNVAHSASEGAAHD